MGVLLIDPLSTIEEFKLVKTDLRGGFFNLI